MVGQSIMLPPHLAAWQHGGVDFLLQQEPVAPPYSLCLDAVRPRVDRPAEGSQPAPHTLAHAPLHGKGQQHVRHDQRQLRQPPPRTQQQAQHAQQQAPPAHIPQTAGQHTRQSTPSMPPHLWPQAWQARLAATRPALALWTYWELGEDFSGNPNAERRSLLQSLLQALHHPAGTHGFWPISLPCEHAGAMCALEAQAQIFWSGVQLLKARVVVVLGEEAYAALNMPHPIHVNTFTQCGAYRVCLVPSVRMLMNNAQLYKNTLALLQAQLAPLTRMRMPSQ